MKTKVSVVMPVYNQSPFLKEAIESILSQSYKSFEFLIIDDKSTDDSLKILKRFKDKRIKIFKNKSRMGLAKSVNTLINKSKGKYIARMDGDDISMPDRLKDQVGFLEKNPQVALVGSWAKIINERGEIIGEFKYPTRYAAIRKIILSNNPFIHPSVMLRKKIFEKLEGYDEKLFYSQDYDLLLRLAIKHSCANIPKYLLKVRWVPDFEKQKEQHKIALKTRLKAVKEYGYHKAEIMRLIKPFLFYLVPTKFKKLFWQIKFKVK